MYITLDAIALLHLYFLRAKLEPVGNSDHLMVRELQLCIHLLAGNSATLGLRIALEQFACHHPSTLNARMSLVWPTLTVVRQAQEPIALVTCLGSIACWRHWRCGLQPGR